MTTYAALIAAAALTFAPTLIAGCATRPPPADPAAALDSRYGIPPGSVPASVQRPDSMLNNGLLPAQPYDGS